MNQLFRGQPRTPRILNKYYIYDPNVRDELGGLRVMQEKDNDGNVTEGRDHVLAVQQQVQWWIDQGLLGEKPAGELSDKAKKLLAQITRGRSENNDEEPKRLPRYDRSVQSGHPVFAAQASSSARFKQKQGLRGTRSHKGPKQEPYTSTNPDNPQAQAQPEGHDPHHEMTPPTTPPR